MTTYDFKDVELLALKGKTILVTGASTGIGRETVKVAHRYGANIAIGDWNDGEGKALAEELGERVLFRKCDVSKWDDVLELFQETWKTFGIINAVLSNAGVTNENFLEDEIDPETGKLLPPNVKTIDINLTATIYVVKCAVHYFKKWPETRCQIVMTGSAASFIDTPPLHLYCASKAGILGFMRSLRTQLIKNNNVTVNMVAPWMTITSMLPQAVRDKWGTLPANEPWGVAYALLLPVVRPDINGKSFFVAGHQIVDFEDKLHETQPVWMGDQLSKDVDEGQKIMIP
ncbi:hypothetical protein V499_01752 [Pseudogymnoascus sp. VKM F-103]|nr:hypothetical protein V499_01752 [Pseudogymnoascus sp. VKM F-103]